jgi:hypothetical protein
MIEKKLLYDESFEKLNIKKEFPLNTLQMYAKLKTVWPIGSRDMLTIQQLVRFQD